MTKLADWLTCRGRALIVRLISTAQTGFFYSTQRLRQGPKLSAVKYDPIGNVVYNIYFNRPDANSTTVKRRVLFVESKKTKKG